MNEDQIKENKLQHLRNNLVSHGMINGKSIGLDTLAWEQSKTYRNFQRLAAFLVIIFAVTSKTEGLKNKYISYGSIIVATILFISSLLMQRKILNNSSEEILTKKLTEIQKFKSKRGGKNSKPVYKVIATIFIIILVIGTLLAILSN